MTTEAENLDNPLRSSVAERMRLHRKRRRRGLRSDFTGGEFVLMEQRPRMQSRAEVVPLRQGDAVAFAVHNRPVQGTRGTYRVNLRHGVSRIRSGMRSVPLSPIFTYIFNSPARSLKEPSVVGRTVRKAEPDKV
jgi:hypothetical protein